MAKRRNRVLLTVLFIIAGIIVGGVLLYLAVHKWT